MLKNLIKWSRQPTTLTGTSLLVAGIAGVATGSISHDMGMTLILAAIPSLLPEGPLQQLARTVAPAAVEEAEKLKALKSISSETKTTSKK